MPAALTAGAIGLASAATARADLAAGTYRFNGEVTALANAPDGGYFVGGDFVGETVPTGPSFRAPQSGNGDVGSLPFPRVDGRGTVDDVATDGSGGYYLAGSFTSIGGQPIANLAHVKSDGTLDTAFAPNPDGEVTHVAASGTTAYASGSFTHVGGAARSGLGAVDATGHATSWAPTVAGGKVDDLAATSSAVYLAGAFTSVDGASRPALAAVSPSSGDLSEWAPQPVQSGSSGVEVRALALDGAALFAVGSFTHIGGADRQGLAGLDATTAQATAFAPGRPYPTNPSTSLAVSNGTVYTDESGTIAAYIEATGLVKTQFHPTVANVASIAATPTAVYAVGAFKTASGAQRGGTAAFSTTNGQVLAWNPSVSDLNYDYSGSPNADGALLETRTPSVVAADGSTVYVGGHFTAAGLVASIAHLAHVTSSGALDTSWAGSTDGSVQALGVAGSTLYAGGSFAQAGGAARTDVAALNTSTGAATTWAPQVDGNVSGLAVSGAVVYVDGAFQHVGTASRAGLAGLDVSTGAVTSFVSTTLGDGPIVVHGGELYVLNGGAVERVDAASGTAQTLAATTPGQPAGAMSLAASGSTLYVAGKFASFAGATRDSLAAYDMNTHAVTSWNPGAVPGFGLGSGEKLTSVSRVGRYVYAGIGPYFGLATSHPVSSDLSMRAYDATSGGRAELGSTSVFPVRALAGFGSGLLVGGELGANGPLEQLAAPSHADDTTVPAVSVTAPTEGQHVAQGSSAQPAFSCDDASGVSSCTASVTKLETSAAGARSFTVTAVDKAGNVTTKTVNYVVDASDGTSTTPTQTTTPITTLPTTPPRQPVPYNAPKSPSTPVGSSPPSTGAVPSLGSVKSLLTVTKSGRVKVRLTCKASRKCAGTVRIVVKSKGKAVSLASGTFAAGAGHSTTATLRTSKFARSRLAHMKSHRTSGRLEIIPRGSKKPAKAVRHVTLRRSA